MKNSDLVLCVFECLKKMNVQDLIVCAGARNLPIIAGLENTDFHVQSYFEERSAGFYSIGQIKNKNRPVAVVTTSGTAVAELLPAVIEAYYQNLPLIMISADRPQIYRGSGSPQSIEHVGIFSSYVESVFDWDANTTDFKFESTMTKPIHFNICFDEPLLEENFFENISAVKKDKINFKLIPAKTQLSAHSQSTIQIENPLAIISELQISDRKNVQEFLIKNQIIHYAEFLSGLKNVPELNHLQIHSSDQFVKNIFKFHENQSVMRIGGIPTLRFWRDLEFDFKHTQVYSFSRSEFSGLARKSQLYSIEDLKFVNIKKLNEASLAKDLLLQIEKNKLHEQFNLSEQTVIYMLSNHIQRQPTYIGNSLPIRMWDGFSAVNQTNQCVCANRGANGIDGQISTYLGWAADQNESWCVVGDLTALYDLASLGLAANSKNKYRVCVINNSGGQIFSRLFGNQKYLNAQNINFKSWAEMWDWDYLKISSFADFDRLSKINSDKIIIEIVPDNNQTKLFWQKWDSLTQ
jgi:2-succinyl-5-enolpyruvyl-6-hydroxy-3-cyclohexene-1-carboxylate synthase